MSEWNVPFIAYECASQPDAHDYAGRGEAVVVTGATKHAPWNRCLPLSDPSYFSSPSTSTAQAEAQSVQAEISMQVPGDIQSSVEYPLDDLDGKAAIALLSKRQEQSQSSGSQSSLRPVLYVKLPLGGSCPTLLDELDLPSFLLKPKDTENDGNGAWPQQHGYQAVSHPIHLRPSTYFCWAYVGEKHTGSKTHVDVLMSDAWLVILTGKKRWAMVHPLDKHYVMNPATGEFADLFNLDHDKFPEARKARLSIFVQNAGDAVFVPSEAPHCVENLEFSFSITYNFCAPSTQHRWGCAMNRVLVATSPTTAPRTAVVDLLLFNRDRKKRVTLRGFVAALPCLPRTDFEMRVLCLRKVQEAFRAYGVLFESLRLHINGVPIGYSATEADFRIVIHYELLRSSDFSALFEGELAHLFVVEDECGTLGSAAHPTVLFPSLPSHFGPVPSYPPLSVLMWVTPYTSALSEPIFPLTTLSKEIGAAAKDQSIEAVSMWHYSRYPWLMAPTNPDAKASELAWSCRTFLFYSSPDVHGPVCLHPLEIDGTLQSPSDLHPSQLSRPVDFAPHFEEFQVSLTAPPSDCVPLVDEVKLYDLSSDLIQRIACTLFLTKEVDGLLEKASAHGLRTLPSAVDVKEPCINDDHSNEYRHIFDIGLEKLMVLALWFSSQAGVMGFAYSHTFSAVEEPGTVCLTGSAAESLFRRVTSSSPRAASLTGLCNLLDPVTDFPPALKDLVVAGTRLDAAFDGQAPLVTAKRIMELKKNATGITCAGDDGEEGVDPVKRQQWMRWWSAIDAAL